MNPEEILDQTRRLILEHAGNDPDKWFYTNRFVFARLQLDERKTKVEVKRRLFDLNPHCHHCGQLFEGILNIHLHRLDGNKGYRIENCTLMHAECHRAFHAQNPDSRKGRGRPRQQITFQNETILRKESKLYDNKSFLYWWDISPSLAERIDDYDQVQFIMADSGKHCTIPTIALKGFLTKDRQTSRGSGNWGVRILKDNPEELAFEPGKESSKWIFFPVMWANDVN